MNIKEIETLIKFVKKIGVSEVSIEQKDLKITIKTHPAFSQIVQSAPSQPPAPVAVAAPVPAVAAIASTAPPSPKASDDTKYITIKSPMIGTFYRSASPDKPVFVNVGDDVKEGMPVCIIEAMKLFNEIESEVTGKIVKVLVDNSTPVEYDQPLFLVDPS
jgi:acetyl-CoA carboxylase biotin carboxyl carrier protein